MTYLKPVRIAVLCLALTITAGCSALTSVTSATKPLDTYELSPLPATFNAGARGERYLEVALPTATGALTSDRIVIKPTPLQVQNLPNARWVNDATEHVQMLLVRSLAGTGRFGLVTGEGAGPAPDYVLLTDLRAFQAEVSSDGETAATVVIRTTMSLLREPGGRVLSTRSFSTNSSAASTRTDVLVSAFDEAMTELLLEVSNWLTRTVGS